MTPMLNKDLPDLPGKRTENIRTNQDDRGPVAYLSSSVRSVVIMMLLALQPGGISSPVQAVTIPDSLQNDSQKTALVKKEIPNGKRESTDNAQQQESKEASQEEKYNDSQITLLGIIRDQSLSIQEKKNYVPIMLEQIWQHREYEYLTCLELVKDFIKDDDQTVKEHVKTIQGNNPLKILQNYRYLKSYPWARQICKDVIEKIFDEYPKRIFSKNDGSVWKMIRKEFPEYDVRMVQYLSSLENRTATFEFEADTLLEVCGLITQIIPDEQAVKILTKAAALTPRVAFKELPSQLPSSQYIPILKTVIQNDPVKVVRSVFRIFGGDTVLQLPTDVQLLMETAIRECVKAHPEVVIEQYSEIHNCFGKRFEPLFLEALQAADISLLNADTLEMTQLLEQAEILTKVPQGITLLERIAKRKPLRVLETLLPKSDLFLGLLRQAAIEKPSEAFTQLNPQRPEFSSLDPAMKEKIRALWRQTLRTCMVQDPSIILYGWKNIIRPNFSEEEAMRIGLDAVKNYLEADIFNILSNTHHRISDIIGEPETSKILKEKLPEMLNTDPYRLIRERLSLEYILHDKEATSTILQQALQRTVEQDPGNVLENLRTICTDFEKYRAENMCKDLLVQTLAQARTKNKIKILRHVDLLYALYGNGQYQTKILPYITGILEEEPDILNKNITVFYAQPLLKRILEDIYQTTQNTDLKKNLGNLLNKREISSVYFPYDVNKKLTGMKSRPLPVTNVRKLAPYAPRRFV